jgi:hypothetical protein
MFFRNEADIKTEEENKKKKAEEASKHKVKEVTILEGKRINDTAISIASLNMTPD